MWRHFAGFNTQALANLIFRKRWSYQKFTVIGLVATEEADTPPTEGDEWLFCLSGYFLYNFDKEWRQVAGPLVLRQFYLEGATA